MKVYNKLVIFVVLLFITGIIGAQGISDLGVVWEKEYPVAGYARNMKTNRDGSGYVISGNGVLDNKNVGSIMVINESGELLQSTLTPVTVKDPTTGLPVYTPIASDFSAFFDVAFKTDDGGVLAFGAIRDTGAADADKFPNSIGGFPSYAVNAYLSYGSWIVKYDANLNVTKAIRVRGGEIRQGWQLSNGNFLVAGMDATSVSGTLKDITLIRIYDQQGNLITDARANFSVAASLYQYPNSDDFILATNGYILKLSVTGNNVSITSSKAITSLGLTQMTAPYVFNITPSKDGGLFLYSNLKSVTDQTINRQNGRGFYKLRSDYTEAYSFISKPVTQNFHAPFLLEGNTYVGNYASGYTSSVNTMYQLIDDGTFNATIGQPLPVGTSIKHVSSSDGFFSIGGSSSHKVAKLSTCVNFKTTSLASISSEYIKEYNPTINFSLPLNYTGNKGTVTYDLQVSVKNGQVNGKQEGDASGGVLYTKTSQPSSSSSLATTINDSWTLNTKYATIEYRFTLHDAYQTAGINQSCGQTYIFRLVIMPQTDVVEMPTRIKDSSKNIIKTSLKNIGEGSFEDYKVTIYDSTLGSATKHTYTLNGFIDSNETSRFELDLAGTSLASSSTLVVSFNDDGTGNQSQTEKETKQFRYTVN